MENATNCKSVFKDSNSDHFRESITQVWITMINQIERSSMALAESR